MEVFYTHFVSLARQEVRHFRLLPLPRPEPEAQATDTLFEPEPEKILEALIPQMLLVRMGRALLESFASEQAARMLAMDQATSNAEELLRQLRLQYNVARQESITKELMDIVGGAEALK